MMIIKNGIITASFDESDGLTCTSLSFKGREYVYFDDKRKREGGTYGIPILFPTPNRVRNGFYVFGGRKIIGNRHGRLRHMPFEILKKRDDMLSAKVSFSPTDDDFPYSADFILTLKIENNSLTWTFEVINKGSEELSYGLALHPYFEKKGCRRLAANLLKRIVLDEEKYPSGGLSDDIALETDVKKLDEDALFITDGAINASLFYEGAKMHIKASDDFNHAVIYTSPSMPSICVEPQSCATNAHNLYSEGKRDLASLIIVKGGESHKSSVSIIFEH